MRHLTTDVPRGPRNKAPFGSPFKARHGAVPFALSLLLFAAGCSRPTSPPPEVARPVKTMIVTAGGEAHVRSFPGQVEASKMVELAFRVPGLLVKLPVKEGQRVAKGEVIAQLRQDEFQARLKAL